MEIRVDRRQRVQTSWINLLSSVAVRTPTNTDLFVNVRLNSLTISTYDYK